MCIEKFFNENSEKNAGKLDLLTDTFVNTTLTYKESKILETLAKNLDNFVPRKEIIENVWNNSTEVLPKTLDVHIYNLRRKLVPLDFKIYSDSAGRLKLS